MKKYYNYYWVMQSIIFCLCFQLAQAQNVPVDLGKCSSLVSHFSQSSSSANMRGSKPSVTLKVAANKQFTGTVNSYTNTDGVVCVIGQIDSLPTSSFFVNVSGTSMYGHVMIMNTKKAYQFSSDADGNAFVTEVDINKIICIDNGPKPAQSTARTTAEADVVNSPSIFTLESNHGAGGCLYLDFDGETVTGTLWKNGATIVAAPSGMTDAMIQETWELVSEDYRPFNLNVTTSLAVFNSYPKGMRMRHIITTSKDVTTTGVAYIGSFTWTNDTPCWGTYTSSGKIAGEVASHECGHTFTLVHDGRWINNDPNNPEEYFAGNSGAFAAPIMGAGYYNPVTQFSKGDYYAYPKNNNYGDPMQDDLALIAGTPGVGFRKDAQGNTMASASALVIGTNGAVSDAQNFGVIETTADLDFFSFTTSGGTVSINANTAARHADLNIELKLYNQSGAVLGTFNPAGVDNHSNTLSTNLSASFSQSLAAGTYYISINGVGDGDPHGDGFSEYGSLGNYTITGTVPNVAVALRTPENPANAIIGLDYKYYEGNWSSLPNFASLTPVKSGSTSVPDISQRARDDQFGFSYTGYISVPTDGSYTFYTTSDDGSKLSIGSTVVVSNDGLHGAQEASGTIGLKAGKHAITVLFFEQGGEQVLTVSYAGPNIAKQTIPFSSYYRVPANPAPVTVFQDCNAGGYAVGLAVGSYTTAQLVALGAKDNDISSFKITTGYEVVVYDNDNFQGTSQTYNADNSCLVTNNFNDMTSSIVVRLKTTTTNVPPTVSLTAPANNASYTAPATVAITANASDADGKVTKVDFYNGSTLLGTSTASPYAYSWTNVAAGTYSITAKATDNSGAVTTSGAVSITVKTVTTNPCSGLPAYVESTGGYIAGSKVQNAGSSYVCKPWPYSGWCNGAAWAYAPGTGTYWTDAWTLSGSCNAAAISSTSLVNEAALSNSPNPFVNTTTIDVNVVEEGLVSLKVYDKTGKEVAVLANDYLSVGKHSFELNGASLISDLYIVRFESNQQVIVRKIVKGQ